MKQVDYQRIIFELDVFLDKVGALGIDRADLKQTGISIGHLKNNVRKEIISLFRSIDTLNSSLLKVKAQAKRTQEQVKNEFRRKEILDNEE